MPKYYSKRALGSLKLFLEQHGNAVEYWLLPSSICFSVPFLFLNLNKKIIFYDYSFDSSVILEKINTYKIKNAGILVVDYFGKSWTNESLLALKNESLVLIQDSCLSKPKYDLDEATMIPDLLIYSTGKAKTVSLNYGAIAFLKNNALSGFSFKPDVVVNETYDNLDAYWKKILINQEHFNLDVLKSEFVDFSKIEDNEAYENELQKKSISILEHKKKLNNIYQTILPDTIIWNVCHDWRFQLLLENQSAVLEQIFNQGLFASKHYASSAFYITGETGLKQSELIEKSVINLFNDFYFDEEKAERCALIIKKMYNDNLIKPLKNMPI